MARVRFIVCLFADLVEILELVLFLWFYVQVLLGWSNSTVRLCKNTGTS